MDKKTTDEQMSCHCCCNTSAMCGGNHKWLWSLLRIALLLAILACVFHLGMRVGSGGYEGRRHRGMMYQGGSMGQAMGCPIMNKGNGYNKREMMNQPANTAPATGEVVNTGEAMSGSN